MNTIIKTAAATTTAQDAFRCDDLSMDFLLAAAAEVAAAGDTDHTSTDRAIALQAIRQNRTESGRSPIAGVRAALWHLSRTEQDELLTGMVSDGLVHAVPVVDATALAAWDHATALLLDGRWVYAIQAR